MNVTATRNEIETAAELLELLRKWEPLLKATEQYSRGTLQLAVSGNCGTSSVDVGVECVIGAPLPDPVSRVKCRLRNAAAKLVDQLAAEACKIIREEMPIPIQE